MELLLCGASKPDAGVSKPERRGGWGSAWGRASTSKGSSSGLSRGDLERGRWGSIKRSATLPLNVGASLGGGLGSGGPRTNNTRAPRSSSPQPHRRHLLPSSTLPTTNTLRQLIHDPYSNPLCLSGGSVVMVDDDGESGTLRRSHTLPINAMRKPPPLGRSVRSGTMSSSSSKVEGSSLRSRSVLGHRTGSEEVRVSSRESTLKRQPSVTVVSASHQSYQDDKDIDGAIDGVTQLPATSSIQHGASGDQSVVVDETLVRTNSTTAHPFRRTLTLPAGAMCRRCPGTRVSDTCKISYVHSKAEAAEDDKENVDTAAEPNKAIKEVDDTVSTTTLASEVPSDGGRASNSTWLGKRHSTTSTLSGLSRFTSTTTTDEGVCVYSEAGSVTSSSVYGSVRGGWSGSSVDEGFSVYSAPSLASSADLSSLSSLYERFGARPKHRLGQGILQKRVNKDEEDEKCNRCQREAGGTGTIITPLRRTRSLRGPRHLPVTPTLLRLLQLRQKGANTKWRCSLRKKTQRCGATVSQVGDYFNADATVHCHSAKQGVVTASILSKKVKQEASKDFKATAPTIVGKVVSECLNLEKFDSFNANVYNSLLRKANNIRNKMREEKSSDQNFELNLDFLPSTFLRKDIVIENQRHLVFATSTQLKLLCTAKMWYLDENCSVPCEPFVKIFVIRTFLRSEEDMNQAALSYVLMSRCLEKDYKEVFVTILNGLLESPDLKTIIADFEKPLWRAAASIFPKSRLQGCAFYWGKAVWRKAQKLGIKAKAISRDDKQQTFINKVLALPFLPCDHIESAYKQLCDSTKGHKKFESLMEYIDNTWISSSLWITSSWNVFKLPIRTCSDIEGWQHHLNEQLHQVNPVVYNVIWLLLQEAETIPPDSEAASEDELKLHQQKRDTGFRSKIFSLWDSYLTETISSSDFLKKCGSLYSPEITMT